MKKRETQDFRFNFFSQVLFGEETSDIPKLEDSWSSRAHYYFYLACESFHSLRNPTTIIAGPKHIVFVIHLWIWHIYGYGTNTERNRMLCTIHDESISEYGNVHLVLLDNTLRYALSLLGNISSSEEVGTQK